MTNYRYGHRSLRKGRYSNRNQIYFLTTVTKHRQCFFASMLAARCISRYLHQQDLFFPAQLLCWVVMPDHIHLLVQLGDENIAVLMSRVKSKTAILVNNALRRHGPFWSKSYHDHALRRDEAVKTVARYIIYNPVRAGLVERPGDYPYWNAIWL